MIRWRRQSPLDVYKLVFGAILFFSPWLFAFRYEPARVDTWTAGALLIGCSIGALVAYNDRKELLMIIIGAWVLMSPWILGYPHAAAMKMHIGIGLLVAYFAAFELWLVHYELPPDEGSQSKGDAHGADGGPRPS
jgi:hypothetical protein